MKKLITTAVSAILIFSLNACGTQEASDSRGQPTESYGDRDAEGQDYEAMLNETFKNLKNEKYEGGASLVATPNLPPELANLPGLDQLAGLAELLQDLQAGQILDISNLLKQVEVLFPTLKDLLGNVGNLPGLPSIGGLTGLPQVITVLSIADSAAIMPKQTNIVGIGTLAMILALFLPDDSTLGGLLDLVALINVGNIDDLLELLQKVLNGQLPIGAAPGLTKLADIPNCDELLGLKFDHPEELIASLKEHAQVINGMYSGDIQDSLLSFLKVAYAQAFQKLVN